MLNEDDCQHGGPMRRRVSSLGGTLEVVLIVEDGIACKQH